MLSSVKIKALISIPFSFDGEIVSVLNAYMTEAPRNWTEGEISFIGSVASQLRAAIESDRLISETKSLAEKEALVNQISLAMRTTEDPEAIKNEQLCCWDRRLELTVVILQSMTLLTAK